MFWNIEEIVAKNFMSYDNIDFNIGQFKNPIFIFGDNGVGKSTVLELIYWTIYGKTFRISDVDSVLSDKKGKNCFGKIVLKSSEKNILEVKRYRNHKKYDNKIFVHFDGKLQSYRKNDDIQKYINKIIGMDYKLFLNVCVFGQGLNRFFANSKLVSDSERKKILEDVFDISDFDEYKDKAKKKYIKYIDKEFKLLSKKEELEDRLEKYESIKNNQKEDLISGYKSMINNNNLKIDRFNNELIGLKEELKENDYSEDINNLDELKDKMLNIRYKTINMDKVFKELESKIEEKERYIKKPNILIHKGERCPTCKRVIDKDALSVFLSINKIEIISLSEQLRQIDKQRTDNNIQTNKLSKKIKVLTDHVEYLTEQKDIAKRELHNKENIVKELEKNNLFLEKNIKDIETKGKGLKSLMKAIEENASKLERVKKLYSKILKYKEIYSLYVIMFSDRGLKNYILNDKMPILNDRIAYYLDKMMVNNMIVNIDTVFTLKQKDKIKDKISVVVYKNGIKKRYENCSGGEQRVIDISILLAFRDMKLMKGGNTLNILISDEMFDWIHKNRLSGIIDVLNDIAKDKNGVMIISHDEEMERYFDNIIEVTKSKIEGSKLEIIKEGV